MKPKAKSKKRKTLVMGPCVVAKKKPSIRASSLKCKVNVTLLSKLAEEAEAVVEVVEPRMTQADVNR